VKNSSWLVEHHLIKSHRSAIIICNSRCTAQVKPRPPPARQPIAREIAGVTWPGGADADAAAAAVNMTSLDDAVASAMKLTATLLTMFCIEWRMQDKEIFNELFRYK